MSVVFEIKSIQAEPAPGMRLNIRFEGVERQGVLSEVYSLTGAIWFQRTLLAPSIQVSSMQNQEGALAYLKKDHSRLNIYAHALLIPEAVAVLEDTRGEDDVQLRFELHSSWRQIPTTEHLKVSGDLISRSDQSDHTIPRSEWIKLLEQMKWSELQIIELPTEVFRSIEGLGDVPKHILKAERSLRAHDYDAVLTHCRKATEAASKLEDPGRRNFNQPGWDALLNKAYPGDKERQVEIDGFTKALRGLLHSGTHAQEQSASRAEAVFVLTTVSSLLSLLAHRVVRSQTQAHP